MKCTYTQCDDAANPDQNMERQDACANSEKTVAEPPKPEVPSWMWGIVAFILANWQLMRSV